MSFLQSLFTLLPLGIAWLGFYWIARELSLRGCVARDWRLCLILATLWWGSVLVLITELGSTARCLNGGVFSLSWLAVCAITVGLAARCGLQRAGSVGKGVRTALCPAELDRQLRNAFRESAFPLSLSLLLAVFLGAVALFTAPTNWDSLTYHLPRVLHWIQDQSLNHYPAPRESQLQMGPWAAFLQLHLLLIGGSDQFVNLPQWLAMVGSAILATRIARQLVGDRGASSRSQAGFVALLVITLPIGMVECVTPQTDYVAAFWLLCLASLTLDLRSGGHHAWHGSGFVLAVGLGLLTKVTFVFYAVPFVLAAGVLRVRSGGYTHAVGRMVVLAAVVGLLNAPHALRNQRLYGSPLGSDSYRHAGSIEQVTLSGTASGLIRNLAMHTGTGVKPLTIQLNRAFGWLHRLTGRDLNDPDTSFKLGEFKFRDRLIIFDSHASCFYHVLLGGVALILCGRHPRKHTWLLIYAGLVLAGLGLISALLRWQMWNIRIHLPLLVVLAPFSGAALDAHLQPALRRAVVLFVSGFAAIVILENTSRPLFKPGFLGMPRIEQALSVHGPQLYFPMKGVVRETLKGGARNVGLRYGFDDAEYPLWMLFVANGFTGRIDHMFVTEPSGRIPIPVEPDVVISLVPGPLPGPATNLYPRATAIGPFTLHWKATAASTGEGTKPDTGARPAR